MLDCTLSQIYRLAAHLSFWKQARIIDSISSRNIYVVSHTADMSKYPSLSEAFSVEFPGMPQLCVIMAQLGKARPYSTCLSDFAENRMLTYPYRIGTTYLEMLSFLLRNDLVVQLHMYIRKSLSR